MALGVKRLTIKGDSQILVNFSNKVYEPKDEHMEAYLAEVRKMEKQFLGLEIQHVPRGTNKEADDIARRASKRLPKNLVSLRNGSSSLQQHLSLRRQRHLRRSSPSHQPREPPPAARPRERAYS